MYPAKSRNEPDHRRLHAALRRRGMNPFDDGGVCESGYGFRVPDRTDSGVARCHEFGTRELAPT